MRFKQRLTMRHLRLIETLGRELSMSKCAAALHTSQSAVSRGLGEIEDIVGAALFERTTRSVAPTSLGQNLIWHAEQILSQMDRAESDFNALSRGVGGTLTVGMMGAFSPKLLVEAINLASAQAPNLNIKLRSNFADNLVGDLTRGRCDMIVTHFDVRYFGDDQLVVENLYNEQISVVAAPGHPLTRRRRLEWADLANEKWAMMPIETSTRRAVERNLLMHTQNRTPSMIEAFELHYIIELVRNANMLAALPTALARWYEKEMNAVRVLPIMDAMPPWAICVARMKSRRAAAADILFVNCLKMAIEKHFPRVSATAEKRRRSRD